jgi:GNAT superfamily N-acetyltransferase
MPASSGAALTIRSLCDDERKELARVVAESWGSSRVVSRGAVHEVRDLPCLVATDGIRWLGVAAYRVDGHECELVLIETFERGHGTGTALLEAVVEEARAAGAHRLWLVTTNDNLDALRFYQRRGLRLVRLRPGAVTEARRLLKPEIPLTGNHDIPIRDELELEMDLTGADPDADQPG